MADIIEDITELLQASEALTISETGPQEIELKTVAAFINKAAMTGQTSTVIQHPLMSETVDALESAGYTLEDVGKAIENRVIKISWEPSEEEDNG